MLRLGPACVPLIHLPAPPRAPGGAANLPTLNTPGFASNPRTWWCCCSALVCPNPRTGCALPLIHPSSPLPHAPGGAAAAPARAARAAPWPPAARTRWAGAWARRGAPWRTRCWGGRVGWRGQGRECLHVCATIAVCIALLVDAGKRTWPFVAGCGGLQWKTSERASLVTSPAPTWP